ncbi:MAG: recombination protein RecR [Ignavibacteriales bacterium]|nr:recombination protein RecR [Ignavibacteriales bacterium]
MLIAEPLQKAIEELCKLPSIGRKTAQRLAIYLLKGDAKYFNDLINSLVELKENVKFCKQCYNLSVEDYCDICKSEKRDKTLICVVEDISDVIAIERTNEYNGLYHVLGGVLSPLDGMNVENLKVNELLDRLKTDGIQEVVLALNPDTEGEATSLYLAKLIKHLKIKVSRIARGIPVGGDLEFSDIATIGRAVLNRIEL